MDLYRLNSVDYERSEGRDVLASSEDDYSLKYGLDNRNDTADSYNARDTIEYTEGGNDDIFLKECTKDLAKSAEIDKDNDEEQMRENKVLVPSYLRLSNSSMTAFDKQLNMYSEESSQSILSIDSLGAFIEIHEKKKIRNNRLKGVCIIVCIIVCVILTFVLGSGFFYYIKYENHYVEKEGSTSEDANSLLLSNNSTIDSSVLSQKTNADFLKRLLPISGESLNDSSTDQYKALQWLVENYNDDKDGLLEETYIIMLLYFATGGTNHDDEWIDDDKNDDTPKNTYLLINKSISVCDWQDFDHTKGIFCDGSRTSINRIILNDSNLTGTIPTELSHLSFLNALQLETNNIRGSIPTELGTFSHMHHFDMSGNDLTGTIPSEMGEIGRRLPGDKLVHFALRDNDLSGTIPKEIANVNAEFLDLSANYLSGTIPTELSKLNHLKEINLGRNKLAGTIPTEFGALTSLEALYLENNLLSGTIPSELGNLSPTEFKFVRLDHNQIAGNLPTEIVNLHSLRQINMHSNDITGDLDPLLCHISPSNDRGNRRTSGEVHMNNISMAFKDLTVVRADTDCNHDYDSNSDPPISKVTCSCCCCLCEEHN